MREERNERAKSSEQSRKGGADKNRGSRAKERVEVRGKQKWEKKRLSEQGESKERKKEYSKLVR